MDEIPMTPLPHPPANLARRILRSPLARILVLGFILLMMMGLNTDILVRFTDVPGKAVQHIIALAIAGFAVYIGYTKFIEQRSVSELALPGMGRELGIGLLVGAGL